MYDFTTITGALLLADCSLDEAIAVAKQRNQRRQQLLQRNGQPNHTLPATTDHPNSPPDV
ncbi:hypothetical protein [Adonisia turfae]|uniref:Uncharacterized protein n=1 Tax=Adonisia turfae CCMR0081 TaxID=2292702 RepID=A0A6M0RGQ7_9CYAN|nr:hypothetical protein [Adonisia turfae]NEZ55467.1 hypothetical protein [Adonisia turfae CCMR0081]